MPILRGGGGGGGVVGVQGQKRKKYSSLQPPPPINLFNYQIRLETLKILKSRTPQSLFQLYVLSTRNNQLYLRARADDTPYIKSRVNIWNNCIKLIARSETLTTIKTLKFKKVLKKNLLKIQNAFKSDEWYPDMNFTVR